MDRVAFSLFGLDIYWYAVVIVSAIVLAVYLAAREERRLNLPKDTIVDLCLVMIPAGILGARAYYLLFTNPAALFSVDFFAFRSGGLAIYGGVIAGIIAILLFARLRKIPALQLLDIVAPSVVLAQGIGRWGNFLNQEAYGEIITNPDWQFFPFGVFIESTGTWHQATFFYESAWCVLVFAFLYFFGRKRKKRNGDIFLGYVILYSAARAVIEGLRQDSLYIGQFRISQVLSLAVLALGLLCFVLRVLADRKAGRRANVDKALEIITEYEEKARSEKKGDEENA